MRIREKIRRSYFERKLNIINYQVFLGVSHLSHGNERRNIEAPPMALPAVDKVQAVQGISYSNSLYDCLNYE